MIDSEIELRTQIKKVNIMPIKQDYYRPSIAREQEEAIDDLFKKYENVRKYYGSNKGKFVEDAIRRLLVFYEKLYQPSSDLSTEMEES